MIKAILVERGSDPMGSGNYGAPRGERQHIGIDYCCAPGCGILSNVHGTVTKLGYCYTSDPSFRYVEVSTGDFHRHRFFYVYPSVTVGEIVKPGSVVGFCQDIASKWGGGMKNHIHYEILQGATGKKSVDPKKYWKKEES